MLETLQKMIELHAENQAWETTHKTMNNLWEFIKTHNLYDAAFFFGERKETLNGVMNILQNAVFETAKKAACKSIETEIFNKTLGENKS